MSVEELINKIQTVQQYDYRIGDILFKGGERWLWSHNKVLRDEKYNGTILQNYLKSPKPKKNINILLLLKIIKQYVKRNTLIIPDINELVLHLRLGDMIEYKGILTKNYVHLIRNKLQAFPTINKITIVTAFAYGTWSDESLHLRKKALLWECTQKTQTDNINRLSKVLQTLINTFNNIEINIVSNHNIDIDLCYCALSKHFIHDIGSFSTLLKKINILHNKIIDNRIISFINIGKTYGSTIYNILTNNLKNYKYYYMNKNYIKNEKYIIWIQNPLIRFVSAFNDTDTISTQYDTLITYFKTPNKLAEGLSSNTPGIKNKAIELMSMENTHIFKGIGWYLNNGNFVKNRYASILFVGKIETIKEDIIALGYKMIININNSLLSDIPCIKNKNDSNELNKSKYLSPLAIQNLIEWYTSTDYAALQELYNYNFITKETLDSYYLYAQ